MKYLLFILVICSVCLSFTACAEKGKSTIGQHDNNDEVFMSRYLTYDLPDTLINGEYTQLLGHLGGNLFCLRETGSCAAVEASDSSEFGWNSYGGVEIYRGLNTTFENKNIKWNALPWNHSAYIEEAETLTGCDAPAVIVLVEHDLYTVVENSTEAQRTSRMWYVFFAKEGSDISYGVYLNSDFYSKEDIIALAKSTQFKEGAFDIEVQ